MLPTLIKDLIDRLNETKVAIERRQFFYNTLLLIQSAVNEAIAKYENEKKSSN